MASGQGLAPVERAPGALGGAAQPVVPGEAPDAAGGLGNAGAALGGDEDAEAADEATEETAEDAVAGEEAEEKVLAPAAAESMAVAAASSPTGGIQPPDAKPEPNFPEAKGNGSLNYRLPIPLPEFRGLQPDVALTFRPASASATTPAKRASPRSGPRSPT